MRSHFPREGIQIFGQQDKIERTSQRGESIQSNTEDPKGEEKTMALSELKENPSGWDKRFIREGE